MTPPREKRRRPASPAVRITTRRARQLVDPRTLARRAGRILSTMGLHDAELSLMLCDDSTIQELNAQYRGKDRPTDVLSFPMLEPGEEPGPGTLLGDVVISTETASRQAKRRGVSPLAEATFLLVHGILHLVGHDHSTDEEERRMDAAALELNALFESARARR